MKKRKKEDRIPLDHSFCDTRSVLLASTLNFLFRIALSFLFFFSVAFPILLNSPSYVSSQDYITSYYEEHSLNYRRDYTVAEFEGVLQGFYEYYEDDYIAMYEEKYVGESFSIQYIYNIEAIGLPKGPTASNYATSYYEYAKNEDGSINVDIYGLCLYDKLNTRGQAECLELLYSACESLRVKSRLLDPKLQQSFLDLDFYAGVGGISSYGAALLLSSFLLPLFFKNHSELGDKIFGIGYGNKKDGYAAKFCKLPLRMIIRGGLSFLTAFYFNQYTMLLVTIFPFFLDLLVRLFSSYHKGIEDILLFTLPVDLRHDHLYKNEAEALQAGEINLAAYEDPEFTAKLSSVETMSFVDRGDGAH